MSILKGVYRIIQAGDNVQPQCLARTGDSQVAIVPVSAQPDPEQEWRINVLENGNITIAFPPPIWPTVALTYEGAPKPELNEHIRTRLFELGPYPITEWHLQPLLQAPPLPRPAFHIQIPSTDPNLGIGFIGRSLILGLVREEDQLPWVLDFVNPE